MSITGRLVTLSFLVVPAAISSAAQPPFTSWGKPGVSFDSYRSDSITCGSAGATRDMTGRGEFKKAMHGIRLQDSILDGGGPTGDTLHDYSLVQRRTMQQQVPALQRFLVDGVEGCLRSKGYVPFVLTKQQTRALGRLQHGSAARFHYLHALASDPAILSKQSAAVPVQPGSAPVPGRR